MSMQKSLRLIQPLLRKALPTLLNAPRVKSRFFAWATLASSLLIAAALTSAASAQTFAPIAPLYFTKTFGGGDPLPQLITVASTGTNFDFTVTAATNTGGTWLTVNPSAYGCCTPTPGAVTVGVAPAVTLAAGTYTGQVVIKSTSGTVSITVPITLTIEAATATYFDQVAGGLTFTMQTNSGVPPAQSLQIRNAGAG
jgi:hypothetical protein